MVQFGFLSTSPPPRSAQQGTRQGGFSICSTNTSTVMFVPIAMKRNKQSILHRMGGCCSLWRWSKSHVVDSACYGLEVTVSRHVGHVSAEQRTLGSFSSCGTRFEKKASGAFLRWFPPPPNHCPRDFQPPYFVATFIDVGV